MARRSDPGIEKRYTDSAVIILAAACLALFLLWAAPAHGVMVIEDDEGKRYFAFTAEEMANISTGITALKEENERLRAKLAKGGCT